MNEFEKPKKKSGKINTLMICVSIIVIGLCTIFVGVLLDPKPSKSETEKEYTVLFLDKTYIKVQAISCDLKARQYTTNVKTDNGAKNLTETKFYYEIKSLNGKSIISADNVVAIYIESEKLPISFDKK